MSAVWNDRQVRYLLTHPHMTVGRMKRELALLGPARTEHAIGAKRHDLGLRNITAESTPQYAGHKTREAMLGWPKVASPGFEEEPRREQDRNYMRALVADIQQRREAA